jgi:hypothetical protein
VQEVDVTLLNNGVSETELVLSAFGQRNMQALGLTPQGIFAIKEMMRHRMLIDIDHMSDPSKAAAIAIAQKVGDGYPVNSGHGLACKTGSGYCNDSLLSPSEAKEVADAKHQRNILACETGYGFCVTVDARRS